MTLIQKLKSFFYVFAIAVCFFGISNADSEEIKQPSEGVTPSKKIEKQNKANATKLPSAPHIDLPKVGLPSAGGNQVQPSTPSKNSIPLNPPQLDNTKMDLKIPEVKIPEVKIPEAKLPAPDKEKAQNNKQPSAKKEANKSQKQIQEDIEKSLDKKFSDLENKNFSIRPKNGHISNSQIPKTLPPAKTKNSGTPKSVSKASAPKKDNKKKLIKKKKADSKVPPFAISMPSEESANEKGNNLELDISPRKVYDYRTKVLPSSISKKEYDIENQHLPKAFYHDEYTKFLFIAASKGDLGGIKALLPRGADINAQDKKNSYTPLMYAIANNKLQIVRYLVARGADVNVVTYEGKNALHVACLYNRVNMINLLITAGVDPTRSDNNGVKPLSILSEGDEYVGMHLASIYSDANKALLGCTKMNSFSCVQHALRAGADINYKNKEGDTALVIATQNDDVDMVNLLVKHDADPNISNKKGLNPLSMAVYNKNKLLTDIIETSIIKRDISGYQIEDLGNVSEDIYENKPKSLFTKRSQ